MENKSYSTFNLKSTPIPLILNTLGFVEIDDPISGRKDFTSGFLPNRFPLFLEMLENLKSVPSNIIVISTILNKKWVTEKSEHRIINQPFGNGTTYKHGDNWGWFILVVPSLMMIGVCSKHLPTTTRKTPGHPSRALPVSTHHCRPCQFLGFFASP